MRDGVAACDAAGLLPAAMQDNCQTTGGKLDTPFKFSLFWPAKVQLQQHQDPELDQV